MMSNINFRILLFTQMLWVNLVMDTMGALALATEPPVPSLLERKPYKRDASLISLPMWRNILCQTVFQLIVVLVLLFEGQRMFGLDHGGGFCKEWTDSGKQDYWDVATKKMIGHGDISPNGGSITDYISCSDFFHADYCLPAGTMNGDCYEMGHVHTGSNTDFEFNHLKDFDNVCLKCEKEDYRLGSLIFNTFIWCQIFNEYISRDIFDEWNMLKGIMNNYTFIYVSIFTWGAQVFLIELGGDFVKTESLTAVEWLITIALGAIGILVGIVMRFIPVVEDPDTFFDNSGDLSVSESLPTKEKPESPVSKYAPLATTDASAAGEDSGAGVEMK